MKCIVFIVMVLGLWSPAYVSAQFGLSATDAGVSPTVDDPPVSTRYSSNALSSSKPGSVAISTLPVISAELAVARFQQRSITQSDELESYSAISVIRAELPNTSQHGEFEVQTTFRAPRTLLFKPIHFVGDSFVKMNIIARLLQSEMDHVEKDDVTQTAISPANYKLSYKGKIDIDGRLAHVFQVKPYKKRPGLFKGRIYLEAHTGSILRAEGKIVKSPSLFVKHIEFVQDYANIGSFTLPVHIHSEARAFFVGRMVIDITHSYYQTEPLEMQASLLRSPSRSPQ